jgi:NADPH-dependent ferric siderophore reductase
VRTPEFLARRIDERRGLPCTVTKIEDLSPRFRRVHVTGDGLRGHAWEPCQVTSFRVTPNQYRHYTVDGFDADAGSMSMLFYRHEPGNEDPAERWLRKLAVDDRVVVFTPATSRRFRAVWSAGEHLLIGDGTTVGLWDSLIRWLPGGARVHGAVELPAQDLELGRELLPGLDVLPQTDSPGAALLAWTDGRAGLGSEHVYLAGHGQTIQRLRSMLRGQHGIDRQAIRTHVYWATGKTGL